MNEAIILIGSNIQPQKNIKACLFLLQEKIKVTSYSNIWITKSVGNDGPDFLNLAVFVSTSLESDGIKASVIRPIEDALGRVRLPDKYAPRTIDLDVIIFNGEVIDTDLWEKGFIAIPVSELMPDFTNVRNGVVLKNFAEQLKSSERPELFTPPPDFYPN